MAESSVTFKGSVNGLTIIIKEEDEFESILEKIEEKVKQAGKFFRGATLDVKYRGKKLSKLEENRLFSILVSKSGADIRSLKEDIEEVIVKPQKEEKKQQNKLEMKTFYFFKGIDEGVTKFFKGTVRSGKLIKFEGNVVIIGDVNPGGEVVATGNVIVMGSLRGIVHAGSDGNKEAMVVAFNLQPTQLRIADVITRSPDEKGQRGNFIPELAFVKDDRVYIESYLAQYK